MSAYYIKKNETRTARVTVNYLLLYAISGFVVVGLETVWIRTLSLIIGNTVSAATAVICVFFLFAAIGNLLGGKIAAVTKKPAFFYGLTEIGFALSAICLYPISSFLPISHAITGVYGLVNNIASAMILIAIPSLFAGLSLPLLLQSFVWRSDSRTGTGGLFYAGNLLGAATGVVCGGIILPMKFGFFNTIIILSVLGIGEGLLAIIWNKKVASPKELVKSVKEKKIKNTIASVEIKSSGGFAILALSGFLGLGIELLLFQYFRQFSSGSLYTVSAVLFAFLVGISAGSLCASLCKRTRYSTPQLLTFFLWLSALMCAAYTMIFYFILERSALQGGLIQNKELSMGAFAFLAMLKTTLIVLPLLVCTGAIFPLAWEITGKEVVHQGTFFGKAVFINKMGCALGAVLIPFALAPWLGLSATLLCIGGAYMLIAFMLDLKLFSSGLKFFTLASRALVVLAFLFFVLKSQTALHLNPGEKLLDVYQGAGSITAVMEDANQSRHIVINQRYILNGTQHALSSQQHESWIPLTLCNDPKNVAFIGVASGISANAALDFPIAKLDAIEIVPDVVKAARQWFSPWNKALFNDPRSSVIIEDGRRVIAAATKPYDCVICDLVLPGGEATNDLYSQDFFLTVKNKLTSQGIFCLWLPLYQMDEELAGMVIKTFTNAFPFAIAVRGNLDPLQNTLGLIGSLSPIDLSSETLQKRIESLSPAVSSRSIFLKSEANFRLTFVADLAEVKNNFSNFPMITDDRPVFAFEGPKIIENGKALRALTFLKWTDKVFSPTAALSSCNLGATKMDSLQNGRRAGNYYYAAAISHLALPINSGKQAQRYLQMMDYIRISKELSPMSKVDFE